MKIARVQTFLVTPGVARNCLFVKLETDDDLVGWGECFTFADRDRVIEQHVQTMAPYLIGRDAFGASIGLAATIHACASMTNFLNTDFYVPLEPLARAMLKKPFVVEDSYIDLPVGSGLGVDVVEAAFDEFPYRPQPRRQLRQPGDEWP
jgi:L-alanine-DL-glutamate epimerase-like enolase superfamily enzyme